jgi:preprotein translocase subunit SecD
VLASKAVNLLAAAVLYFVAVGNVRGFAFTLGLTAIADLLVVFLFTHPVMVMLARTRYFGGGGKHSGLSPEALDAVPLYRGAGRLREPGAEHDGLTIAERRRRAGQAAPQDPPSAAAPDGAPVGASSSAARTPEENA